MQTYTIRPTEGLDIEIEAALLEVLNGTVRFLDQDKRLIGAFRETALIGCWLAKTGAGKSVYETRGVLELG